MVALTHSNALKIWGQTTQWERILLICIPLQCIGIF